ncbi:MAG: hypothetical protein IID18_02160 [Nitrospinae bacterium]|nr:hypothetical protein [Nitrospinota bacterium]
MAVLGPLRAAPVAAEFQYQLYKNPENFGILVFPKDSIFADLEEYVQSIGFDPVESGKAVMRSGSKGLNATYMMPEPVQEKHSIKRFIVLQVIAGQNILVGVFDPDWGLTLPSAIYRLDEVKRNIPKTLNLFRKNNPQRGASFNYKSAVSVFATTPIRGLHRR